MRRFTRRGILLRTIKKDAIFVLYKASIISKPKSGSISGKK